MKQILGLFIDSGKVNQLQHFNVLVKKIVY